MRNTFWLNPLLFSYCPCIHFSSWDTSSCGRVILQRKLSSHLLCFFHFALTSFSSQVFIKRENGSTFWIPWLFFGVSLRLSNSLLGGRMPFQWGTQSGSHSSLACCRKHSLITHWHLLMIYKNQPKKPSCKNESKNRESHNWLVREGGTMCTGRHCPLCRGSNFRQRETQKEV